MSLKIKFCMEMDAMVEDDGLWIEEDCMEIDGTVEDVV